jgi:hypothetical protein
MTIQTNQQILAADVIRIAGVAAQVNVETLSGGKSLGEQDKYYHFLDPGGASRVITLGDDGGWNHPFIITNTADADEMLTVQNTSSLVIGYVARGKTKTFLPTSDTWYLMDSVSSILRYVASDWAKTSDTTLADITGLSANVIAGGVYKVRVFLNMQTNASGGTKVALSGTATVTALRLRVVIFKDTDHIVSNITALNTPVGETAVHRQIVLEGYVAVNAGGTLTVQAAQNASNASATTVYAGSTMKLERMV